MRSKKIKDTVQFSLLIAFLIVVNVFIEDSNFRFDLTEDGRFSIDEQTIETLDKLPGIVRVEVFLDGEMPASYMQLKRGIKDKLQDLNSYSEGKIDIDFIDPFSQPDSLKSRIFDFFKRVGLKPITVQKKEDGKISSKALFPGAVLTYRGASVSVNLLKKEKIQQIGLEIGELSRGEIEKSLNEIEFEFVEGLKMIALQQKKKIGFLTGHGELSLPELRDVEEALAPYYQLYMYQLDTVNQSTINSLDMLVLASPKSKLSDIDKYKIDQFIMQGGHLVCFIDALEVQPTETGLIAKSYDLNLRDLFFTYGVRINDEIILDLSSTLVAIDVDGIQKLTPSTFTPRIVTFNKNHRITKDLQALTAIEFIGSLDTTTSAKGVTKTPLFFSSQYTRKWQAPVTITGFDITHPVLEKETYTDEYLPLAYLLEGDFKSFYKNKPVPEGADISSRKDNSDGSGSILIVGDGSFIANKQTNDGRSYKPVGYATYEQRSYQNMNFFNNTVDYMLGHDFITNKTRKFVSRPLDKIKVKEEKEQWQIINLVVPNVLVIMIGLLITVIRRRRYAKF